MSFAKVAEFQRRGIVHFHAIIRLDGPATATEPYPTPAVDLGVQQLADLVRAAAAKVRLEAPPAFAGDRVRRLRFGTQLDVRPVRPTAVDDEGTLSAERVAAYIAKYATKACEDFGIPTGITGPAAARSLGVAEHPVRIIATAAQLAHRADTHGVQAYDGLGRWLHMLGFRGHFATKSRRYSVTLGGLRSARRRWQTAQLRKQRHGHGPAVDVGHDQDDDETKPRW